MCSKSVLKKTRFNSYSVSKRRQWEAVSQSKGVVCSLETADSELCWWRWWWGRMLWRTGERFEGGHSHEGMLLVAAAAAVVDDERDKTPEAG